MSLDVSADYLLWDNTEAVTVNLVRNSGTTSVTVSAALAQEVTKRTATYGDVVLTGSELVWHVPHALLAPNGESRRIEVNDTIVTASGEVWVVLQSRWAAWRTRWECVCAHRRST